MARRPIIQPVQVRGFFLGINDWDRGEPIYNMVVQVSPRYRSMPEENVVLSVFHRTTGGARSVLLDPNAQRALLAWLAEPRGTVHFEDIKDSAELSVVTIGDERCIEVRIWYTSQPKTSDYYSRHALLDAETALALRYALAQQLPVMTGRAIA